MGFFQKRAKQDRKRVKIEKSVQNIGNSFISKKGKSAVACMSSLQKHTTWPDFYHKRCFFDMVGSKYSRREKFEFCNLIRIIIFLYQAMEQPIRSTLLQSNQKFLNLISSVVEALYLHHLKRSEGTPFLLYKHNDYKHIEAEIS